MLANKALRPNQHGFTLTEVVVAISLFGMVGLAISIFFISSLSTITRSKLSAELTSSSQQLLLTTTDELRYGAGVRQQNIIPDDNETEGWNTSNEDFVIIINSPAVDANREYILDPATGDPYMNEIVYYKQGTVLYKRTLANENAAENSATTTCPEDLASSTCPPDRRLVDYLDSMVFTLYDQDNNITTVATNARSIKVDLTLRRDTFGNPLVITNTIRVTLRNAFGVSS